MIPAGTPAAEAGLAHEVLGCFTAYETALMAGDAAATDAWFADDTRTVRFGIGEEQWGADRSGAGVVGRRRRCRPVVGS